MNFNDEQAERLMLELITARGCPASQSGCMIDNFLAKTSQAFLKYGLLMPNLS